MKIRNGFVSNSSSSSFVVAFPRRPKNAKEVQEILFGNLKYFPADAEANYGATVLELDGDELIVARENGVYPTEQMAQTVWEDIKPQRANNRWRIREQFNGWLDLDKYRTVDGGIDWKAYDGDKKQAEDTHYRTMMRRWNGMSVYVFTYGDDDGPYFSVLEHSGIFDNLPHEQINNH